MKNATLLFLTISLLPLSGITSSLDGYYKLEESDLDNGYSDFDCWPVLQITSNTGDCDLKIKYFPDSTGDIFYDKDTLCIKNGEEYQSNFNNMIDNGDDGYHYTVGRVDDDSASYKFISVHRYLFGTNKRVLDERTVEILEDGSLEHSLGYWLGTEVFGSCYYKRVTKK